MPSKTSAPASEETPTRRSATPKDLEVARDLIQAAIKKGGVEALHNIRPLAISAGTDSSFVDGDPDSLLRPCVEVTPVVNPLFDSVMIALGFDRLGSRSYAIGAGKNLSPKIILSMLEAIPLSAIRPRQIAEKCDRQGFEKNRYTGYTITDWIATELHGCPAGARVAHADIQKSIGWKKSPYCYRLNESSKTDENHIEHAMVSISTNGSQLIVTVCSAFAGFRGKQERGIFFWNGAPDLNLMRYKSQRDPVRVTPASAVAMIETAAAWGFPVCDAGNMRKLRRAVGQSILIESIAGSPGEARIVAPKDTLDTLAPDREGFGPLGASSLEESRSSAPEAVSFAASIASAAAGSQIVTVCDPHVEDVMKMEAAAPTGKRTPLRPYQDEAVSLHLSTDYGYVNACAPGLGKTLMGLFAQREKAASMNGYRSLVVCPAAIRSQWMGEARRFFPEAEIATFTGRKLKSKLSDFLTDAGDKPAVVFLSYDAMRSGVDDLTAVRWNDLICDEAAILGSTGTARSKALWQLREVSDVAVALTGTPINRSLDDLGYIVAWTRGDEAAFHGQKLSKRFDMATDEGVKNLWRALGPTVFRRDRSEIADQLPHIDTEVLTLDPEPAELKLANGARDELRRIYDTLQKKLEIAEELRPDDPKLRQAREDMKKIRGAVLGGVTLARMAACDPNSLRDSKSKSAGVALLEAAKLIDPAIKNGGTKRNLVTGLTEDLVQRGDAVLIFTDFSTVAEGLAADLRKAGVKVGTFTGKNSGKKRDQAALDFQSGDLDCLVLTGAGREGLNLQRASVLIHYDLPWVPSQVVQRVGRASRFGSTSNKLSVLIPIMKGTIEERVASLLVPRAVEALRALDSHRGIKGSETEMGIAVGGLEDAVGEEMKAEKSGLFDLAAEVLA